MQTKTLHMLCAIIACSFTALADDGHGNNGNKGNNGNNDNGSFESGVIGSAPGTSVGGVGSGGAPWAVQSGEASISSRYFSNSCWPSSSKDANRARWTSSFTQRL